MATTDVVTYATSGVGTVPVPTNATTVVMCFNTGAYSSSTGIYDISSSYEDLETKYTDRFDDVYYYVQSG
jgi:hypothetical protein